MATQRSSAIYRARSRQSSFPGLFLLLALLLAAPVPARAQASAADSAAILLDAAGGLAREGRPDAAAALLSYIRLHFAGTTAAAEANRRLAGMPAPTAVAGRAGSGRTELTVWGTTYGIWVGLAVPLALGADGPGALGAGLLLGGPAGFLAARSYAAATDVTEGEARAITFGGSWGIWQGYGWANLAGLLDRTVCPPSSVPGVPGSPCYQETSGRAGVAAALVGGLAGVTTGALLGSNLTVSSGTATAVNFAALWGTGYGAGLAGLGDADGDAALALALAGGDAGLVGAALLAPRWHISRERARLISVAGVAGVLAGAGVDLIFRLDDRPVAVGVPMATGTIGLLLGAHATRGMPVDAAMRGSPGAGRGWQGAGDDAGPGALVRVADGRLELGVPAPAPLVSRNSPRRQVSPALYLPLLHARF